MAVFAGQFCNLSAANRDLKWRMLSRAQLDLLISFSSRAGAVHKSPVGLI